MLREAKARRNSSGRAHSSTRTAALLQRGGAVAAPRRSRSPLTTQTPCQRASEQTQQPRTNSTASEARLRRALGGVLAVLEGRKASGAAALAELDRLTKADPYVVPDDRQLRAIGEFLCGGSGGGSGGGSCGGSGSESGRAVPAAGATIVALRALGALLQGASTERALRVVRAKGVAPGLAARLRGGDAVAVWEAARVCALAAAREDAARALLDGAPGLVALAAAHLAACAPRAAALEAGAPVGAARRSAEPPGLCAVLLTMLTHMALNHTLFAPEAGDLAAQLVPTLVALLALPDADGARIAAALGAQVAAAVPAAALQFFRLGGRGLLRGVEALLARVERALGRRAKGQRSLAGSPDAWSPAVLVATSCQAALAAKRQLLAAPCAAPWAAAAPRLLPRLAAVLELLERRAAAPGGGGYGGANTLNEVRTATAALQLLAAWLPRARRMAEAAHQSSGAAGSGRSSSSGSSGGSGNGSGSISVVALRRCCAACGRNPADGARLHRCRGCGPFTGVMYCDNACAREHWVRRGHRTVCEPVAEQLILMQQQSDALFTAHNNFVHDKLMV